MTYTHGVIVDIGDAIKTLNRGGDLHHGTIETWLARIYSKSHAVPCISTTLLLGTNPGWLEEREILIQRAQKNRIDPLEFLPHPNEVAGANTGLWFLIRGTYLLMGDYRVVEKGGRSLRPGHQRVGLELVRRAEALQFEFDLERSRHHSNRCG